MQDARMTDAGRTVYGGAGISPDEKFTDTYNKFQIELLRRQSFREYIPKYFTTHDPKLAKEWAPDTAMVADFHKFCMDQGATFTEAEWGENLNWTKVQLKREALITADSLDASLKYAIETDPVVLKAIDALPKAQSLLDNAKKQMVQLDKRSNRD